MSLKIIPTLSLLLLANVAFAQFSWGVKTGFQSGNVVFKPAGSTSSNISYLMPAPFVRYQFKGRVALSEELAYERRGFSFTENPFGKIKSVFPSAAAYTLFHYRLSPTIEVFAGPQVAYFFNRVVIVAGERIGQGDPDLKKFDYGVAAGAGWEFSPGYRLNFRYTQSLRPQYDYRFAAGSPFFPYVTVKGNSAIQLALNTNINSLRKLASRKVSFGFHQGIVSSTIQVLAQQVTPVETRQRTYRSGIESGIDMRVDISSFFYFATGLSYIQKGGSFQSDPEVKINYLSLPIIVGVVPYRSKEVSLSLDGGLGLNTLVGGSNPYLNNPSQSPDQSKATATWFYGAELSTDVLRNITLFAHYRRFYDAAPFTTLSGNNSYTDYQTRGSSFSIGIRQRIARRERPAVSDDDPTELVGKDSRVGIKLAVPVGWISYNDKPADAESSPTAIGLTAGVFFKIRTGKRTAIVPEIQYSSLRPGLVAIENPLLFSYGISKHFSLEGGGQWRIFLKRDARDIGKYTEYVSKPVDLGILAGGKYKLSSRVSVGLRYYMSTVNLINWQESGYPLGTGGKMRSLQTGIFFGL